MNKKQSTIIILGVLVAAGIIIVDKDFEKTEYSFDFDAEVTHNGLTLKTHNNSICFWNNPNDERICYHYFILENNFNDFELNYSNIDSLFSFEHPSRVDGSEIMLEVSFTKNNKTSDEVKVKYKDSEQELKSKKPKIEKNGALVGRIVFSYPAGNDKWNLSFVHPDGTKMSIDPEISDCSVLNLTDEVYVLNQSIWNHSGSCMVFGAHNVTLNCNGSTIDGIGSGDGVRLINYDNNTIINCTITEFDAGIYLRNASFNLIHNNSISDSTTYCIQFWTDADYNNITNNYLSGCVYGINLGTGSSNSVVFNNSVATSSNFGIWVQSSNHEVNNNSFCDSDVYDFYRESGTITGDNNTCDIPFNWNDTGTTGCTLTCSGSCFCRNCTECTTQLANASCSKVYLNSTISDYGGDCIDDPSGFSNKVFNCNHNIIDGAHSYPQKAIRLNSKQGNTIEKCNITDFWKAIQLESVTSINITDCNITSNSYGIFYHYSTGDIIRNNYITDNYYGLAFHEPSSSGHTLYSNYVCGNTLDIYLLAGSGIGFNNTCYSTGGWNDNGTTGCTYGCNLTCSDGTIEDSCSDKAAGGIGMPWYCEDRGGGITLYENCSLCGCEPLNFCNTTDEKCYPVCSKDFGGVNVTAPEDSCFPQKPWYCVEGGAVNNVTENSNLCGCLPGKIPLANGSCSGVCYASNCSEFRGMIDYCDVIYLSQDITATGNCIYASARQLSQKIIDCRNYSITGAGVGTGISLYNDSDVKIINCSVYNFSYGIMVSYSDNITLVNDTTSNNSRGLLMVRTYNSTVSGHTSKFNSITGVNISDSENNTITYPLICNNTFDVFVNKTLNDFNYSTCDLMDGGECNWSCNPLFLEKVPEKDSIRNTTNITYTFYIYNKGRYNISNLNLTDSISGNVNLSQTNVFPGQILTATEVIEINDTTINNATVTGIMAGENYSFTASSRVKFNESVISVTKTLNTTSIRRLDMGGANKFQVNIEVCGGGNETVFSNAIDLVFSVDCSGSMSESVAGTQRIVWAKEGIYSFIDTYLTDSKDRVGAVCWDSSLRYSVNLSDDFGFVKDRISAFTPLGRTDIDLGLANALSILETQGRSDATKIVILLTDGNDNTNSIFPDPVPRAIESNISVYSIGTGAASFSIPFLKRISCGVKCNGTGPGTGGWFRDPPDADTLNQTYHQIAIDIRVSTLPRNVTIREIIQSNITVLGNPVIIVNGSVINYSVPVVTINENGSNIIAVNIDNESGMTDADCAILRYNASSKTDGINLPIQLNTSRVDYYDMVGTLIGSESIPVKYLNVTSITMQIRVNKTPDKDCAFAGEQIIWTVWINNTGNVDLRLTGVDNYSGSFQPYPPVISPNKTSRVSLIGSITNSTVNLVNVSACFISNLSLCIWNTSTARVNLSELNIVKTSNKASYTTTENITYTVNVTNTGYCGVDGIYILDADTPVEVFTEEIILNEATGFSCSEYCELNGYSGCNRTSAHLGYYVTWKVTPFPGGASKICNFETTEGNYCGLKMDGSFGPCYGKTAMWANCHCRKLLNKFTLSPGGTQSVSYNRTLNGTYVPNITNTAKVYVEDFGFVSGASLTVTLIPTLNLSLTKVVDDDEVYKNSIVTYNFTVTNIGDVDLTNIILSDPNIRKTTVSIASSLAKGASVWTALRVGIINTVTNNATVFGTYSGSTVNATATETVSVCHVSVTKTANDTSISPGDKVNYTIFVLNDGDCDMYNITPWDTMQGNLTTINLLKGANYTYWYVYQY